jgi:hypothetical protein
MTHKKKKKHNYFTCFTLSHSRIKTTRRICTFGGISTTRCYLQIKTLDNDWPQ